MTISMIGSYSNRTGIKIGTQILYYKRNLYKFHPRIALMMIIMKQNNFNDVTWNQNYFKIDVGIELK